MSKHFSFCCYIYYSNRIELESPERRVPLHPNVPEYEQQPTTQIDALVTYGIHCK
jgi:hypothetical protein